MNRLRESLLRVLGVLAVPAILLWPALLFWILAGPGMLLAERGFRTAALQLGAFVGFALGWENTAVREDYEIELKPICIGLVLLVISNVIPDGDIAPWVAGIAGLPIGHGIGGWEKVQRGR